MSDAVVWLEPDCENGHRQRLRLEMSEWRQLKGLGRNLGIDLDDVGFGHDVIYHFCRVLSRLKGEVHPLLQRLRAFLNGPGRAGYSVRREKAALVPAAAAPARPRRGHEVIDIEQFRVQPRPGQPTAMPQADEAGVELYLDNGIGTGASVKLSRSEWVSMCNAVRRTSGGYAPDYPMLWREAEIFAQHLARCAERLESPVAAKVREVVALCRRRKTVHISKRRIES